MPNCERIVTLNAKMEINSEHQTENMALNAKLRRTTLNIVTEKIWRL